MNYYAITSLLFKNGEWVKHPGDYTYPFEYSDAGIIHTVKGEKIYDHIKWYHDEQDAVYVRDGLPILYENSLKGLICRIKWALGLKRRCGYFKEVGVYEKGGVVVYIYRDWASRSNVSFYTDGRDAYILFGESDCCRNMLTDLIDSNNDHGPEITYIIALQIYSWCYENALTWISDLVHDTQDESVDLLYRLRKTFGPVSDVKG